MGFVATARKPIESTDHFSFCSGALREAQSPPGTHWCVPLCAALCAQHPPLGSAACGMVLVECFRWGTMAACCLQWSGSAKVHNVLHLADFWTASADADLLGGLVALAITSSQQSLIIVSSVSAWLPKIV